MFDLVSDPVLELENFSDSIFQGVLVTEKQKFSKLGEAETEK